MANRIVEKNDVALYGLISEMVVGDLIIDSPNKTLDGLPSVSYYFVPKEWPDLREGATIWVDGARLGPVGLFRFCNTSKSMTPWHIKTAKFKNIPGTEVHMKSFQCAGLVDFHIQGSGGLTNWSNSRKFLTGTFGFHSTCDILKGNGFNVKVLDGGKIKMEGFESQFGFAGIRIQEGNEDITLESLDISNFYIHDTGHGEGQYIGQTTGAPYVKIKNANIHNGIIARSAAEAIQIQHMVGNCDVHHITIFAADTKFLNEFGSGQDTGIQWNMDGGINKLHHIILDGFGSVGLMIFGGGESGGGVSEISDILFNDGRGIGIYLHNSMKYGVKWNFSNLHFKNFNMSYFATNLDKPKPYVVSSKNGIDEVLFKNISYDGINKSIFFQSGSNADISEMRIPKLIYRNSGFSEPANKIKQWSQFIAAYFDGPNNSPTYWEDDDIAIDADVDYRFYKCVHSHYATNIRPSNNENFYLLTWDDQGIRCDDFGWNENSIQSYIPPDDLRLIESNCWNSYGIQLKEEIAEEYYINGRRITITKQGNVY